MVSSLSAAAAAQGANADAAPAAACASGDRECGRSAYSAGTQSFDRGDYAEALSAFRNALGAGPHPFITFNIALCLERLGKPVEARAELRAVLADASAAADLKKRASEELNQAERALSHITLQTPPGSSYAVELDGAKVEAGAELEVDPGEHRLRVASPSAVVFDQAVRLEVGEHLRLRVTDQARSIDVVVVPEAAPPKAATPGVETRAPAPVLPARKPHGLPPAVFYAAASATVVLGAITVWSGLDVRSAYSDYQYDRPHLTPDEAEARIDSGHALERRTNVLIGATAVAAVATTALGLFFVDFGGRDRSLAVGVSGNACALRGAF